MRFINVLATIIILFFFVIVYAQNIETLKQTLELGIDMWTWSVKTPPLRLYFFLLFFFLLGAIFSFAMLALETLRFRGMASKAKKAAAKMEAELNSLRSLPAEETAAEEPAQN